MKAAVLLAALAACTEPAVEMTLVPAKTSAPVDLSCVGAVDLLPIPVDDQVGDFDIGMRVTADNQHVPCVDLARSPTSFADLEAQIAGKFDMPLPPGGLAGVELRGRPGNCEDVPAYHMSVFYGGALFHPGEDSLAIPVRYNVSCDQQVTMKVHTVDLISLIKTKTCTSTTIGQVFEGTVRPTMLDAPNFPATVFEAGPAFLSPDKNGISSIPTYNKSFEGSCLSASWVVEASAGVSSCITPGAPTACSGTDVELPTFDYAYANSAGFGSPLIGAVWSNTGTPGPVTGATITPDETAGATITYGDVGDNGFQPTPNGTSTNTSGMFTMFAQDVVGVTVAAPGHPSRHVFIGNGPELPGTALIVLQ